MVFYFGSEVRAHEQNLVYERMRGVTSGHIFHTTTTTFARDPTLLLSNFICNTHSFLSQHTH
jgi:hypothetical protein